VEKKETETKSETNKFFIFVNGLECASTESIISFSNVGDSQS